MNAVPPPVQHRAVLAGLKAMPCGWPPASLHPGHRRRTPAGNGSTTKQLDPTKFGSLRFEGIANDPRERGCRPCPLGR